MPDYVSGSGYRIAPVLGDRPARLPSLRSIADEVDDVFEVPLALPDGPGQPSAATAASGTNQERFFYAMPYEERYIWGVTAGIIRTLYERLYA